MTSSISEERLSRFGSRATNKKRIKPNDAEEILNMFVKKREEASAHLNEPSSAKSATTFVSISRLFSSQICNRGNSYQKSRFVLYRPKSKLLCHSEFEKLNIS